MIEFSDVIESLKTLEDVKIYSGDETSEHVTFSKGDTRYIITKPEKSDLVINTDFSIAIAIRYSAIEEGKIPYIKILEIINEFNKDSGNPCKISYRKILNGFAIEIGHLMLGQGASTFEAFIESYKKKYIPMAILSMMVLLLETSSKLKEMIDEITNGDNENEKDK